MKLNDFLTTNQITMATFAQAVGTTTATVSRVADGLVVPRKALLTRIYKETGGQVTPNDLVGLYCVKPCALGRLGGPQNKNSLQENADGQ